MCDESTHIHKIWILKDICPTTSWRARTQRMLQALRAQLKKLAPTCFNCLQKTDLRMFFKRSKMLHFNFETADMISWNVMHNGKKHWIITAGWVAGPWRPLRQCACTSWTLTKKNKNSYLSTCKLVPESIPVFNIFSDLLMSSSSQTTAAVHSILRMAYATASLTIKIERL